jgi:Protein of unknown function (DUF1579)
MPSMPQPSPEHLKLHRLAGTWAGDEKLSPSPWGPGGPARGRITGRVAMDGFFVVSDYEEEKGGQVTFRGHSVFGWDQKREVVVWYWVDSMGMPPPQATTGGWDGDKLVFSQASPEGHSRFTHEFQGGDRYLFRMEASQDGKSWSTMMEGDYRRMG